MPDAFNQPDRPDRGDIYAFDEEAIVAPPLPGEVVAVPTFDEVVDRVAADLVAQAEQCVRQFGDFHLALSGGRTPQPLYERLMYDPRYRMLPWRRTHLWFVEERCVPFDSPHSNYREISETIGDHSDIPPDQFHPIFAESPTADTDYETQIREALEWREKGHDRLDFVLLTLGADGHTAGLFPFDEALDENKRWMRRIRCTDVDPSERVTMTLPFINAARFVAVLAGGYSKAEAVQRLAYGEESPREFPIKGVEPIAGELMWYLDSEACGQVMGE
ncbi:MAG: 6-phosphogluconolactonase [Phycisphaerales bacterium]|nr:MAG: 6-phosphogluconolactonase [Phycisphaerales bacterium]